MLIGDTDGLGDGPDGDGGERSVVEGQKLLRRDDILQEGGQGRCFEVYGWGERGVVVLTWGWGVCA